MGTPQAIMIVLLTFQTTGWITMCAKAHPPKDIFEKIGICLGSIAWAALFVMVLTWGGFWK